MNAYITDIATFLPNEPVDNDRMEEILGMVSQVPSRTRKIILRNNGIKQRHYALDPANGAFTHTNAQLAAEAINRLQPAPNFTPATIECLCCGTSSPDQLMPGHASMVHGELGAGKCEVMSTAGICLSGITALKYGAMNVALGNSANAVATGSELASSFMRANFFGQTDPGKVAALEENPALSFEADFLRWMLSDGAGAIFMEPAPRPDKLSLRIDWIEILSHADELETCMYAGAIKNDDGTLTGWRQFDSIAQAAENGAFAVKQDAKLLNRVVIPTVVDQTLPRLIEKYSLQPDDIAWYLPHYSSNYFRQELYDNMTGIGFEIPFARWFNNLADKGNTGSASFYIMLEELFHSGRLNRGDRILSFIPESGRFSIGYALFTVV